MGSNMGHVDKDVTRLTLCHGTQKQKLMKADGSWPQGLLLGAQVTQDQESSPVKTATEIC